MNLFAGLKQAIASFASRSTTVADMVALSLLEDPDHLIRSCTKITSDPQILDSFIKRRAVFDSVLRRLSSNPEALFRMLSSRDIVSRLAAQTTFLKNALSDTRVLKVILKTDGLADCLLEQIASDELLLNRILVLSTLCLEAGQTPSSRIKYCIEAFAKEPVFRSALQRDSELRLAWLEILRSGYASAGVDPSCLHGDEEFSNIYQSSDSPT